MYSFVRCMLLVSFLLIVTACGGTETSYSHVNASENFTVQMTLDHVRTGKSQATIEVWNRQKQPIEVDEVIVAPVMPAMGHASPEITAQKEASGVYQANGSLFFMTGEWEVHVYIRQGDVKETFRYSVQVNK